MTTEKCEVRRSRCSCLNQPSTWCKGAVLVFGPVIFLVALLMQAGMLQDAYSSREPWEIIFGSVNPVEQSSRSSNDQLSSSSSRRGAAATCLSRTQHMLHRPASQIIPSSPALVAALTAYEKHHAECSRSVGQNWTETFLRSRNPDGGPGPHDKDNPSGCQFLVFVEGGAGLGNRLISLVSAFLYALLTNRILLVVASYDRGHIANLLCEPFPESSWGLPQDFPLGLLDWAPNLADAIKQDFNSSYLRLQLEHSQSWGDQRFFCAETRERIRKVKWVSWHSNQYFVPRLFTFPEFWPQLPTLFPNASHTFTHLSRYLLLPNNALWEKIFRIHSSYLSAEKLVGIQIRRHSVPHTGEYSTAAFERVMYCLVAHGILPNSSKDTTSFPTEQILELMDMRLPSLRSRTSRESSKKVQQQHQVKYIPGVTSVLIASLQHKYAEVLQDLYTNYPTIDGRLVRVHMVTHDGQEWHSYDQAQKALVEMWLLSLSDYLATSAWSTFGYVAQGLGALQPYIVNLRGELNELSSQDHMHDEAFPNSHCVVGQSAEPCNHYPFWPKTDCGNGSVLTPGHEAWIEKHLLRCQDETNARQLVS